MCFFASCFERCCLLLNSNDYNYVQYKRLVRVGSFVVYLRAFVTIASISAIDFGHFELRTIGSPSVISTSSSIRIPIPWYSLGTFIRWFT